MKDIIINNQSTGDSSNYIELKGLNTSQLCIILLNTSANLCKRDEALYQVLNVNLKSGLMCKYQQYTNSITDSFDDTVQDFFLYLRGSIDSPYSVLESIHNANSFNKWLLQTYRNFLSKLSSNSYNLIIGGTIPNTHVETSPLVQLDDITYEQQLTSMLSTLIAYCLQESDSVEQFIFLRAVLTKLDKTRALPEQDVAQALGLSYVYYRVIKHRLSHKIQLLKQQLENGAQFALTKQSSNLAKALNGNFSGWYEILIESYNITLSKLVMADAIESLRLSHADASGVLLHESQCLSIGCKPSQVILLWNSLPMEI